MEWKELREKHPGLPESSEGYHQHPRGRGWVSDDSIVSDCSNVGPDCVVDGGSQVSNKSVIFGGCRITGESMIIRGQVAGARRGESRVVGCLIDGSCTLE